MAMREAWAAREAKPRAPEAVKAEIPSRKTNAHWASTIARPMPIVSTHPAIMNACAKPDSPVMGKPAPISMNVENSRTIAIRMQIARTPREVIRVRVHPGLSAMGKPARQRIYRYPPERTMLVPFVRTKLCGAGA
jgi:hypothetical protein